MCFLRLFHVNNFFLFLIVEVAKKLCLRPLWSPRLFRMPKRLEYLSRMQKTHRDQDSIILRTCFAILVMTFSVENGVESRLECRLVGE